MSFAGRVAIVTGAGGRIGREYAIEVARRGGRVLVNDLGGDLGGRGGAETMAEQVVEEIRAAGGEAVPNGDSVATMAGCAAMVERALAAFGRIDALVCNAGILGPMNAAAIEDAPHGIRLCHARNPRRGTGPGAAAGRAVGTGRTHGLSKACGSG